MDELHRRNVSVMERDGVAFLTLGMEILSGWRGEAFGEVKEFMMVKR